MKPQMKWFVWNPNGTVPRFEHESEMSARHEAERLARLSPGIRFLVLQSIAEVRIVSTEWTQHIHPKEETPF